MARPLHLGRSSLLNRRHFLSTAATGVAASLALHGNLLAQLQNVPSSLPDHALLDRDEDSYWAAMRRQFLIPEDEIYLNNGTVGSSPAPVLRAIFDAYNSTEKMDQQDPEDYPIWGYASWNEFRDPLAAFVGANRDGCVVKRITLPRPVKDAAQVLNLFNDAITPRTRVLFFSHITTFSGVVLPAKELSALARSKGILSAVDGAHVPGMMRLNIHELGCDLYSSSPHKWLMAPKGSGFLYVRDEVIDRLWNTIATEGWDDPKLRAERFQRIGSSNVPALWGLRASIKLANDIGLDRIERRHRALADYILAEMLKRGAASWTSPDPALRCAIVTVNAPPVPRMDLENWLWKTHRIRIRGAEPNKLRLSTPYYLQKKDIDRFLEKFEEYKRDKKLGS